MNIFNINGGTEQNPVVLTQDHVNALVKLQQDESVATKSVSGYFKKSTVSAYENWMLSKFDGFHIDATVLTDDFNIQPISQSVFEGKQVEFIITGISNDYLQYQITHDITIVTPGIIDEDTVKSRISINVSEGKLYVDSPQENASWQDSLAIKVCPIYEDIETTENYKTLNITARAVAMTGIAISSEKQDIAVNGTSQLSISVLPANCSKIDNRAYCHWAQPEYGYIDSTTNVYHADSDPGDDTIYASYYLFGKSQAVASGSITLHIINVYMCTVRIDQTVSDPNSKVEIVQDTGFRTWLRNNTHRYLAKLTAAKQLTVCQLEDGGGKYYYDGTHADLSGGEGEWMQIMPTLYWYCDTDDTDVVEYTFGSYKFNDNCKVYTGRAIGVAKGYVANGIMHSYADVDVSNNYSYTNGVTYSTARGDGFSMVLSINHRIVGCLFYMLYESTDSQAKCGYNSTNYHGTGLSVSLGMTDTSSKSYGSQFVNFLGLEDWWGDYAEWVHDYTVTGYNIQNSDGTVVAKGNNGSDTWVTRMKFGQNLDLISSSTTSASDTTTYYADRQWYSSNTSARVASRSGHLAYASGGVADLKTNNTPSAADTAIGSRLAFSGTIVHAEDVAAFKAAKDIVMDY